MTPEVQWIVGRDTGTSSKTIWSVMMLTDAEYADVPYDPDDFGRCYRLLAIAPKHWRENLGLVAQRYPIWGPLVREWDRLTVMYERVIAGSPRERWNKQAAEEMYEAMRLLIDEGRLAAGWTRTGPNSWMGPRRKQAGKTTTVSL